MLLLLVVLRWPIHMPQTPYPPRIASNNVNGTCDILELLSSFSCFAVLDRGKWDTLHFLTIWTKRTENPPKTSNFTLVIWKTLDNEAFDHMKLLFIGFWTITSVLGCKSNYTLVRAILCPTSKQQLAVETLKLANQLGQQPQDLKRANQPTNWLSHKSVPQGRSLRHLKRFFSTVST